MILGIDVVFVHAQNPEKLAQWYKDILDIEIGYKTPDLGWQEFALVENRPVTRFAIDYGGPNPSEVEKQPIMISFGVANIQDAIESLEQKGVSFFGENKINDVGPTLVATFKDPEDNWIQLSQRK